jgi:MFS family permease
MEERKVENQNNEYITDMDKAYDMAEGRGWYKYLALSVAIIAYLCHMLFLFSIPFFFIQPDATCNLNGYWHKCTRSEICDSNPQPLYRLDAPVEYNMLTEFGWYCRDDLSSWVALSFFIGTAVSVFIVSSLGDVFGRIPVMSIGVLGNMVAIVLLVFIGTPEICYVSALMIGLFSIAGNGNAFNFVADSVPAKYKDIYPSVLNIFWALGEVLIALVMWTGIQWRGMCLVMFIIGAAFFVPLAIVRESPKYHFHMNNMRKAYFRLQNMAWVNGVTLSSNLALRFPPDETQKVTLQEKLRAIFCDRKMCVQVTLVSLLFAIGNMVFYAMSLNLEHIGGNIYVNGILLALAEIVSCLVSGFSLRCMKQKTALSVSFAIMVVGLIGLTFFWDDPVLSIVFCFIGKLGSTAVDNLLYTVSCTLFPTAIEGTSLGIALLITRFGNMAAKPLYLAGHVTMCVIMLILGACAIVLPIFLSVSPAEALAAHQEEGAKEPLNSSTAPNPEVTEPPPTGIYASTRRPPTNPA